MEGRKRTQTSLLECAELVLPRLTPVELANASLSCESLRLVAASVTASRTSDAARGMEAHPIPFLNPLSLPCPPYSFFLYLPSALPSSQAPPHQPWPGTHTQAQAQAREGVSLRLNIAWNPLKGWCLCAGEAVPEGAFVCEYSGELLTTAEARRRQRGYSGSAALIVVREHLPSGKACLRLNIDATASGNVARFINHSCDGGNLSTQLVRKPGSLLPRLCFFASEDICSGDELTFSYGGPGPSDGTAKPCYCGAPCCSGSLPSEPT